MTTKRVIRITVLMVLLMSAQINIAHSITMLPDDSKDSALKDSLDKLSTEELNAYYDSIYRAGHPKLEKVQDQKGRDNNRKQRQMTSYSFVNNHVPNSVTVNTSKSVGQIEIQSSTSPTGAKVYVIPIKSYALDGVFSPEISLCYNSQGGGSCCGKGWSVGGLQTITRGHKNIYYDGYTAGMDMHSSDAYYLNGARMVRTTDLGYETEQGHIKAVATTYSNDISAFTVSYPNGYTASFHSVGAPNWIEYPISTLTDNRGKTITYNYVSGLTYALISSITYDNGQARIDFTYDNSRADYTVGYKGGNSFDSNYLLKKISCKRGTTEIATYDLSYSTDANTSLLTKVDYYANGCTFNPLTFYYGDGTATASFDTYTTNLLQGYNFSSPSSIFVTRGRIDYYSGDDALFSFPAETPYFMVNQNASKRYFTNKYDADDNIYVYNRIGENYVDAISPLKAEDGFINLLCADVEGDQLEYAIKINNKVSGNYDCLVFKVYRYNIITGISLNNTYTFNFNTLYTDGGQHKSVQPKDYFVGDFNGDGRMEILAVSAENPFGEKTRPSKCYLFDLKNGTKLYEGHLFNYTKSFPTSGDLNTPEYNSDKVFPLDYDGDGKTDICHISTSGMYIYTFDVNGSTLTGRAIHSQSAPARSNFVNRFYSCGDFNGDGLTDLVISDFRYGTAPSNLWTMYLSKGDGTFQTNYFNGPDMTQSTSDFCVQDVDGDGISDITEVKSSQMINYLCKNNTVTQGATTQLNSTNEKVVPVSIFSSALSSQFVGMKGYQGAAYSYKTSRSVDQALTGVANSNGVVEKNFYYKINKRYGAGIYTLSLSSLQFPYSYVYEGIPVLAGDELYKGGSQLTHQEYRYENAVLHRQGLGFRGFEKVLALDNHGYWNTTVYEPCLYGMVKSVDTHKSTTTFQNEAIHSSLGLLQLRVNTKTETDKLRGVTGTTQYTYNTDGNPTNETTTLTGGITVSKTMQYFNGGGSGNTLYRWGRLDGTSTTTTRGSSTYTESESITSYNSYDQPLTVLRKINGGTVSTLQYTYDSEGNMTAQTVKSYGSSTGRTTTYQYTTGNRMTSMTPPVGLSESYTYNVNGTIAQKTTSLGTTNYTYDGAGRPVSETRPDGITTTISLSWDTSNDGLYAVTKTTTGRPVEKTVYDALNREVRSVQTRFDGTQLKKDKVYDTYGNLIKVSIPFTGSTPSQWDTYSYDFYDRLTATSERGKTVSYGYDGLTTTVNDGTMSTATTTDALGGVVSVTDPAGTINYTLNGAGNPTQILSPSDNGTISTTITYDSYGRRTKIVDPSHGTTNYSYGTDGHLQSETDAKGNTTTYSYDNYERLTTKGTTDFSTTYSYNTMNMLASATSNNGTSKTYTYDGYGRLSSVREDAVDGKWLKQDYTYSSGRVSAVQYTSQSGTLATENYTYANGHLSEVKLNNTTSIFKLDSENAMGMTSQATTGNLTRIYSFNSYGLPVARVTNLGGTTKNVVTYTFNAATGNLTTRYYPLKSKTENFTYDNLHRLTNYGGNTVTYDSNGNIATKGDIGTFTYGISGKPYAVSGVTLSNSISVGTQTVTYNSIDRPGMITDNGYTVSFTYNDDFERVKMSKVKNSQTQLTRYYLGGCYELDVKSSGNIERLYLNGGYYDAPAVLIKQGGSSNVYNIIRDHLGSITHVMDASGTLIQELNYDAWGRMRDPSSFTLYTPTNEPEPYLGRGYCGHEHLTGLGLINMNARLYDPLLGRFLSPDPYVQAPENSQSFNRYSYCLNNPLRYNDITGEWFGLDDLIVSIVGGAVNLGVNLVSGNIHSIGQGVSSFLLGAAAGEVALYGQVEISAFLVGAGNSIINQGFTNGWNNINWGSAVLAGGMSMAFSALGSKISSLYSNQVNQLFSGISNDVLRNTLSSGTIGSLTGFTIEGGLTLANGGSLSDALNAGLQGAELGFVSGAISGLGSGIKEKRDSKRSPWTGEKTQRHHSDPKFLGGENNQELTTMSESRHHNLHNELNDYLFNQTDGQGHHMRPQRGNSGKLIRNNFNRPSRVNAIKGFYDTHPFKYYDARYDFYKNNHFKWTPW